MFPLAKPLEVTFIENDPRPSPTLAAELGVELVDLTAERIAGAGLDVCEEKPDPSDPLFALDNVVISPPALWLDRRAVRGMRPCRSRRHTRCSPRQGSSADRQW
jgi:phosphoglycerate dehydrogenase-like enzyme